MFAYRAVQYQVLKNGEYWGLGDFDIWEYFSGHEHIFSCSATLSLQIRRILPDWLMPGDEANKPQI